MSAFAMLSLQSPSLLAFDTERTEGNVESLYGLERVPCDTPMRERLDPIAPASLRPLFTSVLRQLQRGKALEPMTFLDGHYGLALDGTGYVSATTIPCASCLHQVHRNGSITSAHQMLGAAIIHPDWREVMPLLPEPMVKPDGTDKNDGERHAAKRFVATWRQDHPHRKFMVTEDRLSSHAPHLATLPAHDRRDILGVKDGAHTDLFKQVQAAEQAGRVSSAARHDHVAGRVHRFRLVNDVPLNESTAEVWGNFIESWDMGADNVQHVSWGTDLRVSKRHVYRLMCGGRARWKIAHETFQTLKNQGDHFEHHDGHGQQHLSVVFAMLMMLACLVDQTQQRCGALFQAVWTQLGSTRLRWERMRALCYA